MIQEVPSINMEMAEPQVTEKKTFEFTQDSGISIACDASWTSESETESDEPDQLHLDPAFKVFDENLKQREDAQKLDRKRHLLVTKLQHLRKCANILVIGPDNAGKTSLINSLGYMIREDEQKNPMWKQLAEYDLGRSFKYKLTQMWPLERQKKDERHKHHVCFYESGGFEKVGDIEKSSTILQYILEGRITACNLLQMFLMMNTNDITERYREDPNDPRVLEERRIDAIIHVTPADRPRNEALFNLVTRAVNNSKDPRIRKMPILTCVTTPHSASNLLAQPVRPLKEYDLGCHIRKIQMSGNPSMRRNHSMSRISEPQCPGHNLCEPSSVRQIVYYQPDYDQLLDESDISNISPQKDIDRGLLQLFEDTLRVAQREHPSIRKRFLGLFKDLLLNY